MRLYTAHSKIFGLPRMHDPTAELFVARGEQSNPDYSPIDSILHHCPLLSNLLTQKTRVSRLNWTGVSCKKDELTVLLLELPSKGWPGILRGQHAFARCALYPAPRFHASSLALSLSTSLETGLVEGPAAALVIFHEYNLLTNSEKRQGRDSSRRHQTSKSNTLPGAFCRI